MYLISKKKLFIIVSRSCVAFEVTHHYGCDCHFS